MIGSPQPSTLTPFESSLFEKANILIPPNASEIFLWPSMSLSNNIIVPQYRSRSTKRNNSCINYVDTTKAVHWGMLEKLISFKDDTHYYCLVSKLIPLDTQICTDDVTNAKLHNHLIVCQPPRYAISVHHNCYNVFLHCSSPSHQEITLIDNIIEKCIIMDLSKHLGLIFVSKFPNFIETD